MARSIFSCNYFSCFFSISGGPETIQNLGVGWGRGRHIGNKVIQLLSKLKLNLSLQNHNDFELVS